MGPKNHVFDGTQDLPGEWGFLWGISQPIVKYRKYMVCDAVDILNIIW